MIKMKLHVLLAEKRMTQKELSEVTEIRLPTISTYCTDTWKTISREHINKLCKTLGCKTSDLIEYAQD